VLQQEDIKENINLISAVNPKKIIHANDANITLII
jgi:hypothetical protein